MQGGFTLSQPSPTRALRAARRAGALRDADRRSSRLHSAAVHRVFLHETQGYSFNDTRLKRAAALAVRAAAGQREGRLPNG